MIYFALAFALICQPRASDIVEGVLYRDLDYRSDPLLLVKGDDGQVYGGFRADHLDCWKSGRMVPVASALGRRVRLMPPSTAGGDDGGPVRWRRGWAAILEPGRWVVPRPKATVEMAGDFGRIERDLWPGRRGVKTSRGQKTQMSPRNGPGPWN